MKTLDANLTLSAIRLTGDILAKRGVADPVRILIVGGAAGLLGGWLRPGRTTGDCDAMRIAP